MNDADNRPAVVGQVERPVRPILEPLFLLHCGALFGGERDEWDVEANSGRAVDALADQHPGETLHLYALTPDDVAAVNKHRAGTALGPCKGCARWTAPRFRVKPLI